MFDTQVLQIREILNDLINFNIFTISVMPFWRSAFENQKKTSSN